MAALLLGGIYGRDTSATTSVNYGRMQSGILLVGEAIFRRFISTRGSLRSDLNYGLNVIEWLQSNDPNLANTLALQSEMRSEAMKDERLDDATVTIAPTRLASGFELAIQILGVTSAGPTFTLAVSVSNVSAELLDIQQAA